MGKYWIKILLLYCGVIPFLISIVTLLLLMSDIDSVLLTVVIMVVSGLGTGFFAAKREILPVQFGKRYAPIVFPLALTLLLWMISTIISGGFYGSAVWGIYAFLQLPFGLMSILALFTGVGSILFLAPVSFNGAFLISFFITERSLETRSVIHKPQLISMFISLLLIFTTGQTIHTIRSKTVLPSHGFDYEDGYSSTDLWPYNIDNPDHSLPRLTEESTFIISDHDEAPVLDGAEAAFPVYSAFALATYDDNILKDQEQEYVSFTNTIYGFERLLDQEIDIFFGAEPSNDQQQLAKKKERDLSLTPIGKEAFVFFVNKNNPIHSLDVSEIKDIYSGKITNWQDVGGNNEKIIAFQRPQNSGSQTLLEKVMDDTPLITPLKEEVPAGMGGILEQVADYRNYENSLGFSFRFFATGMHNIEDMKLLAIDGIEPNPENISKGAYPFSTNLYAITLKSNPKSTIQPFLDWMQGPQGQEIIEKVGYIKLEK